MTRPPHRLGFSLIELLVTVSIIAILIAILLPFLGSSRLSALNAKCKSNLKQVVGANITYSTDREHFVHAQEDNYPGGGNRRRWYGQRTDVSKPFEFKRSPLRSYLGDAEAITHCPVFDPQDDPAAIEAGGGGYGYNATYLGGGFDRYDAADPNYIKKAVESATKPVELRDPSNRVMFADAGIAITKAGGSVAIVEHAFVNPPLVQNGAGDPGPDKHPPTMHFRHIGDKANVGYMDGHVEDQELKSSGDTVTADGTTSEATNRELKFGWFTEQADNLPFHVRKK